MTLDELIVELNLIAEEDPEGSESLEVTGVVVNNPQGVRLIQRAS